MPGTLVRPVGAGGGRRCRGSPGTWLPLFRVSHVQSTTLGIISDISRLNDIGPMGKDRLLSLVGRCALRKTRLSSGKPGCADPRYRSGAPGRCLLLPPSGHGKKWGNKGAEPCPCSLQAGWTLRDPRGPRSHHSRCPHCNTQPDGSRGSEVFQAGLREGFASHHREVSSGRAGDHQIHSHIISP